MMTFLKLSKLLLCIILLTFLSKISLAGITSISHLDWETQQSIKMACILEKMEGPKKYDQCIRSHLNETNGITSISHLDWETQQSIKMACILEKMEGPKKYDQCIRSHLSDIDNSYNSDEYYGNNSDNSDETPNILGSSYVWSNYIETIKDIRVSNLRIKVVKVKDNNCKVGYDHIIEIEGMINDDTVFILDKILQDAKKVCPEFATLVTLNSGGGYINSGIEVGRLFRKYAVATYLTKDQKCMSSCSTAFLGGYYRDMKENSQLMMHSPYLNVGYNSIRCASKEDVNNLLIYYQDMIGNDLGKLLFDRTMQYCDTDSGWTLNKDAAEVFGIIN